MAVSGMVSLPRPGDEPTVYFSPNLVAVGPGWVQQVVSDSQGMHLRYQDSTGQKEQSLLGGADVESIGRDGVVLNIGGSHHVLTPDGTNIPFDGVVEPGGRVQWNGPFDGFEVTQQDDKLVLMLPRSQDLGTPLMGGTERLLGAWWVRGYDLPDWETTLVTESFRKIDTFFPEPGRSRIDGSLQEWTDSQAVPVNNISQVTHGLSHWDGERDSSFSVALRHENGEARLGIRILDDDSQPGVDQLRILHRDQQYVIPVPARGEGVRHGEGWRAVGVRRGMGSLVMEIGLSQMDAVDWSVDPLVISYEDRDGSDPTTTITSAPWPSLLPVAVTLH